MEVREVYFTGCSFSFQEKEFSLQELPLNTVGQLLVQSFTLLKKISMRVAPIFQNLNYSDLSHIEFKVNVIKLTRY